MTVSSEKIVWHMLSGYRTVKKGTLKEILQEARKVSHMPYRIVATYGSKYHKDGRNLYASFPDLRSFLDRYRGNP